MASLKQKWWVLRDVSLLRLSISLCTTVNLMWICLKCWIVSMLILHTDPLCPRLTPCDLFPLGTLYIVIKLSIHHLSSKTFCNLFFYKSNYSCKLVMSKYRKFYYIHTCMYHNNSCSDFSTSSVKWIPCGQSSEVVKYRYYVNIEDEDELKKRIIR